MALLVPAVQAAREAARRSQCDGHLKQVGLAMQNYHDVYKCFPPAIMTEKDGTPKTSWRVAVLPFVEAGPLYDKYNKNEPWDSPANRALTSEGRHFYRCPSDPTPSNAPQTNYVRIIGPNTIGGKPNEAVRLSDVTDGVSNTIMAVEVSGTDIPWAEPRDLTVDEFLALLDTRSGKAKASQHPGGFQALFGDGSVRFISDSTSREAIKDMLIRNDGKTVTPF